MRTSHSKIERELRVELERVQSRLVESEATTAAIRNGDVDAIVVEGRNGKRVFTLQSPDDPYRTLTERMNEGAATLSADGTILFCNRRLAEMVEIPSERLLGASLFAMLPEDQRDGIEELLQTALEKDLRSESELLRKDGTVLPVQLSLSMVTLGKAEKAFCLIATDLGELKRAKRSLREQSEIFELAQDAILIRDLQSRILSWNRGARDVYGWPAKEALGRVSHELFHTVFPEPLEAIMAWLQEKKEWEGELRHIRRDGRPVVVASRWSLLRDESGHPTRILEINRDVTASREAEIALQKSEIAYRRLAELVPQLIWKCTPDGLSVYFNQQWVNYTGLTLEQSYGRGWNTPFHPDDKAAAWKAWNHAVETGDTYRIDCRLRAADGNYRWFLIKGIPVRDEGGAIVEWLGTCTDIEDLKRAGSARAEAMEELRTLNNELESRVAARTQELAESVEDMESFAYSVSHDLRAPLRHLDGYLSLLFKRSYSALDEQAKHYIDSALDASQRMGRLIDELLQFSRLGRGDLHMTHVDLHGLVEKVRAELEPGTRDRVIHWSVQSLPVVEADQGMLRQAIQNLLENALKFTRNVAEAKISIGCKSEASGELVFSVEDNGAGFDVRYYNKLFQVFQRLHGEDEFEGTGIGLATVRRIVERHGGRVWAEGAVGAGAAFHFSLPRDCGKNGGQT